MSPVRFIAGEALHEFRTTMRGPFVPLIFAGLVGYVAIVVLNAEYMQQMGATDVARNSAHVVQLMTIGQSFWLFFAWAWLFSRAVTRDGDARLREVVLAAPVSLWQLMVGRYLGVLAVAVFIGLSSPLGFLVVHPLEAVGALPAGASGPPPWGAMLWGWLVFTGTSAVGVGALYLAVALQTRNAAVTFAIAAILMAIWMFSMVIMRGGDINPTVATILDPTGYGAAEAQANDWTPIEKMTNLVAITPALQLNRLLWAVLPTLPLVAVLFRLRREDLVLDRSKPRVLDDEPKAARSSATVHPGAVRSPSWVRATLQEGSWHLERSLGSWGLWIAMGLLCLMCVAGSFVHVVAHAEGPLVPRPELLVPMLSEFLYITIAFVIAGFVGVLMRRDEEIGFYEIVSAAPAPLGVRLGGRALAAVGLTLSMMLVPIVACYVVTGLAAAHSFSVITPIAFFLLVYAPALLELCGATMLCHAAIRSSGLAYAVSMILTFIFVVNHEISVVSHPLAEVGIPAHVTLSELVGWGPWLPMAIAQAVFKVGLFVAMTAFAWLLWSRGYVDRWTDRLGVAAGRLWGGAAVTMGLAVVVLIGVGVLFNDRLIVKGDYQSAHEEDATRAEWEKRWMHAPPAFQVEGGDVEASFDPETLTATARWTLRGVRSPEQRLRGELPSGVEIARASVQGRPVDVDVAADAFELVLGSCASDAPGCAVEFVIHAARKGWPDPHEGKVPWLQRDQAWLTASDLLPRLGVDPHRALRNPNDRRVFALPEARPRIAKDAAVSATGVAPAASWRWRVEVPDGWSLPAAGRTHGALDFAVVWRTRPPRETRRAATVAIHGPSHEVTAQHVLADLEAMSGCVANRLGLEVPKVAAVVQAPRHSDTALRGNVLLLPEDQGWDVGETDYGRWNRRRVLARTIAAASIARRADVRQEPGARWLLEGVPGWVGLSCVREVDGDAAWVALAGRGSETIVKELGALEAPVKGVALDASAGWVETYAALSTFAWAQVLGEDRVARVLASVVERVAQGASLRVALEEAAGPKATEQLLGRPLASDVALVDAADAGKTVEPARRWTWADGGWRTTAHAEQLLLIPHGAHNGESRNRIISAPSSLEDQAPATVIDAWPSFERSIGDNVWSPGS